MRILAILLGWLYYRVSGRNYKIAIVTLSLAFTLWVSYFGFGLWLNRLNYGTFTGRVTQILQEPLIFYKPDGMLIDIKDLEEDFIIVDFWNGGCGICIEKLPVVQEVADIYRENGTVGVYSVYCWHPDRENFDAGNRILTERNFTFPNFAFNMKIAKEQLGIAGYPAVLIFDKDRRIIFRGDIENARKEIKKLTGE